MADERNEWLDHEAAERLLRGEPVDADDDYTRWQVERLAKALDSARGATAPLSPGHSGELPGEAAAVAAFRAAHSARGAKPQVAAGSDLGSVRIGAALRAPRWARPRGWMRPARWGLAASVAGLAVGGVAVAAGTGVIPAFGGDDAPVPAVSAAAPGEVEAPEGHAHTPPGSHRHGTPTDPASPPPLVPPGPSKGVGGTATPGGGTPDDNDGATPGRTEPDWGRTETRAPDGTWPARTTQACRDLRDGRLDTARRQQLELAARGSGVQQFCDQVLSGGGRQSGGTPPGTGTGTGTGGAPDIGTGTGGGGTSGGGTSGGGSTGGGDRDSGDPDTDRGEGKPGGKGRTDDKGASGRTSGTQHQKSPAEPPTGKRA